MKTKLEMLSFEKIVERVRKLKSDTILIIVDERVWSLYNDKFSLEEKITDKKIIFWIAPRGEESKRISEFEKCIESLLEQGVHRNSHLIAIGGGALSDFAGFVASTILRGIDWSVVPTTLLSMVDSAIGGKVAINSRFGKNLIGAFHRPVNVWINTEFLNSLSEEEIKSGTGEVLKYAFLSKDIYEMIIQKKGRNEIIKACANFKLDVVNEDPFEKGKRKILNFGHTLGHALEKASSLKHGVAVVWGMAIFFLIFNEGKYLNELKALKNILGWGDELPPWNVGAVPTNNIISYMEKDKKIVSGDTIDIVLVEGIGKPVIREYTIEEIKSKVKSGLDESINIIL